MKQLAIVLFCLAVLPAWALATTSLHDSPLRGFYCTDIRPKGVKYTIGLCVRTSSTGDSARKKQGAKGHKAGACRASKEAFCFYTTYPNSQRTDEVCYTTKAMCRLQRNATNETDRDAVVSGTCAKTK